ncbi:hypothetical protein [Streptomyces sp. NPDC048636]|uniref:hypothetical protein n=1 Tax=Streptomyces sp. NPDC048636 TaxID=3155762 RepID=UPI00341F9E28
MKSTQAALVFTGGYLVGRRLKMRWAVTLAGLTAGSRLLSGHDLVGGRHANSSELAQLGQELRSELMTVGRSAAMTTISNRMNSLSDVLGQRASALRAGPNGQEPDESSSEREKETGTGGSGRSRG